MDSQIVLVVGLIVSLISILTPIIKLNTTINKLNFTVSSLQDNLDRAVVKLNQQDKIICSLERRIEGREGNGVNSK